MKAFLLAAGHGTRLRPLTDTIPKCLLPIQGKPMMQIWLELCQCWGIQAVLVNTHSHADQVRDFVGAFSTSVQVHISEEPELLGSAGTLLANQEFVENEPFFWVFYADVLNRANLEAMLKVHLEMNPVATIGVSHVPDPSRCGVVRISADGVVREFVEKPAYPSSNIAFTGLMLAGPEFLSAIPEDKPVDIGFHVLPKLVDRMAAFQIRDYLIDIGTFENYETAQETWPGL